MKVSLTKSAIDLGIVTKNAEGMCNFYQNTLGFEFHSTGKRSDSVVYRLMCGDSMIKIVQYDNEPDGEVIPGGPHAGVGYRYWTMTVENIDEIVTHCENEGHVVVVPTVEIQAGARIAMIEDPDGNWIEFLQLEGRSG